MKIDVAALGKLANLSEEDWAGWARVQEVLRALAPDAAIETPAPEVVQRAKPGPKPKSAYPSAGNLVTATTGGSLKARVYAALQQFGRMSTKEIADKCRCSSMQVSQACGDLIKEQRVGRVAHGVYEVAKAKPVADETAPRRDIPWNGLTSRFEKNGHDDAVVLRNGDGLRSRVLDMIEKTGVITVADLAIALQSSSTQISKTCVELMAAGKLENVRVGTYKLAEQEAA